VRTRGGPYADAPRLPLEAVVPLRSLVQGAWTEIEVGPGPKAGFLSERALAAPNAALLALEIRRKWAQVGDDRMRKEGHGTRARVFCEDAREALGRLSPAASVKRVFLHFPDPWWKKRHTKRLVMGDAFLDQVARLLEISGELYVQTDVEERAALYENAVNAHAAFAMCGDKPESARMAENPYEARSPREHRAIADGLPVFRMRWTRR
jgi:tRNA (guanine-N7-)-methyltransferase